MTNLIVGFLWTRREGMVRTITVRTAIHKLAFRILADTALVKCPAIVQAFLFFLPTSLTSTLPRGCSPLISYGFRYWIAHCHIPHLVIYFTPVSCRIFCHQVAKCHIIVRNVFPDVRACSCIYYMYILPDFSSSGRLGLAENCGIDPKGLFPFANAINAIFDGCWNKI